jgi:hypothetical protein
LASKHLMRYSGISYTRVIMLLHFRLEFASVINLSNLQYKLRGLSWLL